MSDAPTILLVEDDEVDHLATRRMLSETFGSTLKLDWISDGNDALAAIRAQSHEVYLVDHNLGPCTGLDLIRDAVASSHPGVFILLTGHDSMKMDQEAMKSGATDYLVKGEITAPMLARTIRHAIEHKKFEQRLTYLAECDELTGLSNRTVFHSSLNNSIAHAKRTESIMAVLLLDLDHFKDINDTLGHPIGDLLIKEAAKRLLSCTRPTDAVARLGGDEFAIVATSISQADDIVSLVRRITESLAKPFVLDGHEVSTSASTGITVFPMDSDCPDDILKHADLALYQAKRNGRGTYFFYDAELNARAQHRKMLETELKGAMSRNEFSLHFQPKVSISCGVVVGAEALLRWKHAERGMIPPDQFIPIAESTGLISALGEWVLSEACRQTAAWRREGLPPIPIAVNVSAVQFRRTEFVGDVERAIENYKIDPSWIELEITETTIMDRVDVMKTSLRQLHDLGVRVAIDDFGTGHSSLAFLSRFPVDTLKIDRSFVNTVIDDLNNAKIAKAIISLGKSLNMRIVAEGVESEAQLSFLRKQGCEEAQGFYFSRPLPADEFTAWYRENDPCVANAIQGTESRVAAT